MVRKAMTSTDGIQKNVLIQILAHFYAYYLHHAKVKLAQSNVV